jgi:hypothetical protein
LAMMKVPVGPVPGEPANAGVAAATLITGTLQVAARSMVRRDGETFAGESVVATLSADAEVREFKGRPIDAQGSRVSRVRGWRPPPHRCVSVRACSRELARDGVEHLFIPGL